MTTPHPMSPEVFTASFLDSRILHELSEVERQEVAAVVEQETFPPGADVVREGESGRAMYFIVSGEAQAVRGRVHMSPIGVGAEFGSLGLLTGRPRATTVRALTPLVLAKLSHVAWQGFVRKEPDVALKVVQALFAQLRDDMLHLTDDVAALLQGRARPRAAEVSVTVDGVQRTVRTGTRVVELLPREVGGELVVGALLGQKPVGLATPIVSTTAVSPLLLGHFEGRNIYARSLQLLLLEAAHAVAPAVEVRLGPSRGTVQEVEVKGAPSLGSLAEALTAEMQRLVAAKVPFHRERWAVDEARAYFHERGWDDAAQLLSNVREGTVALISCGRVYALNMGPTLPDTGALSGFRLSVSGEGLLLELGQRDPRHNGVSHSAAPPPTAPMSLEHRRWLDAMGVKSVGGFNRLCVSGQVVQLLRVAEGFHEKQIGHIADLIAQAKDRLRIIAIAGPSSSGKTTFIKRLTVQLQINGLHPIGLSLDDYYVDREKTVRDAKGDYDFEALEALDLPLLQEHVRRLLAGQTVKMARYDFKTGKSAPAGGAEVTLGKGALLMMEGIHGLNPKLLGEIPQPGQLFRAFVHPATTLPFDRLNRVSATDLRLLRRIVRDRHGRGYSAAENIARWPSVLEGERRHIFPFQREADVVFDTALSYEPAVLKVYAERYLLEVPPTHPSYATALRLRHLIDRFVAIYPDHVPPTSIIREFIGGSGFEY